MVNFEVLDLEQSELDQSFYITLRGKMQKIFRQNIVRSMIFQFDEFLWEDCLLLFTICILLS